MTKSRKKIESLRGMHDITPAQTPSWRYVEQTAANLLWSYGYREVRTPIVERTELFRRSVGEATDIVEKEMYTFADRDGESLSLRPECTASCVRAAVQHSWLRGQGQRLWHIGPMFRHEKPQKERYRQFHQLDVEVLGYPGPDVDAELIVLTSRLWRRLGLQGLRLELNSLGSRDVQQRYREALTDYFNARRDALDEDSLRRLETNPLRILDSKNPTMHAVVDGAPEILDFFDEDSQLHWDGLRASLDAARIEYHVNPRLVRGLDYYTRTVFEWVTDDLGSQNAVCGGGRYDGLVADIGGASAPATGFAVGLERLIALLEQQGQLPTIPSPDVFLVAIGREPCARAHGMAEALRERFPERVILVDAGPGSLRAKMKRADRSQADYAVIVGENELERSQVLVKHLRSDHEDQTEVARSELEPYLEQILKSD